MALLRVCGGVSGLAGCEVLGQGCPAGKGNGDLAEILRLLWLVRVSWPCDRGLLWEWGK